MDKIKQISVKNNLYPTCLKSINNPPVTLYFQGKILPKENCFAIVGARHCSGYGKQVALKISKDLAESGLTIVSGLALGIDTLAHLAAVERGLRTIAVLGTGLDEKSIYPKSNIELSKRILRTGGCLISEYPSGTKGAKFTFPQRNRIISGLSMGVLVIEAKIKSGALITAQWARKQGRKVFVIPGSIFSLNSRGCHYLIKKGAKLVENANDILKEINIKNENP
jgi:DNA processing protein